MAQPRVLGVDPPGTPAMGTPKRSRWQPLPVGEFVLGHLDAEGVAEPRRPLDGWAANGSYLVIRKLHQDVAGFRSLIHESGQSYPGGPDLLAAKLVGRWPDGTPLSLSPGRARPRPSRRTRPASTTSASPTIPRACAARWAPTSVGPTRATGPAWAAP